MAKYKPREKKCPVQLSQVGRAKAALRKLTSQYQPPAELREATRQAQAILSQVEEHEHLDNKLRFKLAAVLRDAKERVGHGQFEIWQTKALGLKRRTVQKVMAAGTRFGDLADVFSQLSANQIYALAMASDAIVDEARKMAAAGTLDRHAAAFLVNKAKAEKAAAKRELDFPELAAKADRAVEIINTLEGPIRSELVALLRDVDPALILARLGQAGT